MGNLRTKSPVEPLGRPLWRKLVTLPARTDWPLWVYLLCLECCHMELLSLGDIDFYYLNACPVWGLTVAHAWCQARCRGIWVWPFPLQTPGSWSTCPVSPQQSPQEMPSGPERAPARVGLPVSCPVVPHEGARHMATAPSLLPWCCVLAISGSFPLVISLSGKIKKKKQQWLVIIISFQVSGLSPVPPMCF